MSCSTEGNQGIIKFAAAEAGITIQQARQKFHELGLEARSQASTSNVNARPNDLVRDPDEYIAFLNAQRRLIAAGTRQTEEDKQASLADLDARIRVVQATGRPLPTNATLTALRSLPAALQTIPAAQQQPSRQARRTQRAARRPNIGSLSRATTAEQLMTAWESSDEPSLEEGAELIQHGSMRLPHCERCGQPATLVRNSNSHGSRHYYCPEHGHGLRRSANWTELQHVRLEDLVAVPRDPAPPAPPSQESDDEVVFTVDPEAPGVLWHEDPDATDGVIRRSVPYSSVDPETGTRYTIESNIRRQDDGSYLVSVTVRETDNPDSTPTVVASETVRGSTVQDASAVAFTRLSSYANTIHNGLAVCPDCRRFLPSDGGHQCPSRQGDVTSFLSTPTGDDYFPDEDDLLSNGEWLDDEFDDASDAEAAMESAAFTSPGLSNRIPVARVGWLTNAAGISESSRMIANAPSGESFETQSFLQTTEVGGVEGIAVRVRVRDSSNPSLTHDHQTFLPHAGLEEAQRRAEELTARFAAKVASGEAVRCENCGQFLPLDGDHVCPAATRDGSVPTDRRLGDDGLIVVERSLNLDIPSTDEAFNISHAVFSLADYRYEDDIEDFDWREATAEEDVEAFETVVALNAEFRAALGDLENDLVEKFDAGEIGAVTDGTQSITVVGGRAWNNWDEEGVNAILANRIAEDTTDGYSSLPSAEQQQRVRAVAKVIQGFGEFAQISRFRVEPLREAHISPRQYAEAEPAPRRIEVKGAPHNETREAPDSRAITDFREHIAHPIAALRDPVYREAFRALSADEAAREYASMYVAYRQMRVIEQSAEDRAVASVSAQNESGTPVHVGEQLASVHQGSAARRFDRAAGTAALVPVLAPRANVSEGETSAILEKYERFAVVSGFRVRPMRAVGIEDDTYSRRELPRARLVLTSPAEN